MKFDIFFSISQTPDTSGYIPSESEMFANFLDQAEKADELFDAYRAAKRSLGAGTPQSPLRLRASTANCCSTSSRKTVNCSGDLK